MDIHERLRRINNEKVQQYADKILEDCQNKGFTVSDMKDLAEILPSKICRALISVDEKTVFNNPSQ